MAMVEVPGGSAVGGRSSHDRRTTPFFLEGRLEKAERRATEKKQVTTDGETPVTIPFISLGPSPMKGNDVIKRSEYLLPCFSPEKKAQGKFWKKIT